METIKKVLNVMTFIGIILFIMVFGMGFINLLHTNSICENAGGTIYNSRVLFSRDNCVINGELYGIYPKGNDFFTKYELSKYPIGARNG